MKTNNQTGKANTLAENINQAITIHEIQVKQIMYQLVRNTLSFQNHARPVYQSKHDVTQSIIYFDCITMGVNRHAMSATPC